ncbi:amino acid adenylation domain-containing protein [Streptomyces filamentosus]|uniref:non-ribosomal peptide synthetase n=1 Tax=Streptomyces filamentosus TaxID=67294 RepID=UPI0036EB1081
MTQESELLRRLRSLPAERREQFLQGIGNVDRGTRVSPLTFRQEQLWVFDKVSPGDSRYALAFAYTLHGDLDQDALSAALDETFDRHTVLRSVFPHDHPTGEQIVRGRPGGRLTAETVGEERLPERCEALAREELRHGFDLDGGPLVRLRLLKVAEDRHVLLWFTHHLVFDPRSAEVVLRELAAAYAARTGGTAPQDRPARPQFGAYAAWQREWAESEEATGHWNWWRGALSGWESTEIAPDRPRGLVLDLTAGTVQRALDEPLAQSAAALAGRLGVPVRDVLLAAYFALVGRLTSRTDLLIGVPGDVFGTFDPDLLVGDCGQLLPVRVDTDGATSFADLVRLTHEARIAADEHGGLPFKRLLSAAGVEPDQGRLPLVQIGFEIAPSAQRQADAGDLTITLEQLDTGSSPFEFALTAELDAEAPVLRVRYATSLYAPDTARLFLDRYLGQLRTLCADPEASFARAPLATEDERRAILTRWNAPAGEPEEGETVHGVFAAAAAAHPDRTAVTGPHGTLTYRELDRRANALAHRLAELGAAPGELIGVAMRRTPLLVEAVLAVLKSGAAYVPLDLGNPASRNEAVLTDAGVRVVLGDATTAGELPDGPWQLIDVELLGAEERDTAPEVAVDPADLAYSIFTSGSTGRPKGVLVEHRNVTNFVRTTQEMFGLTADDRFLAFASTGFDVSVFELFGALLSGASVYLADEDERRDISVLDRILSERRITVIDLPPAIMDLLTPENYPELRVCFVGGEAFSGELTTRWAAGGRAFWNGYGPTETTVTVIAKRCEGTWHASPPIGRAMRNHRAYVLDEKLDLLPPSACGELAVAGAGLGRGYLGRPDQTAERFRPDPYGPPGSRMYLTGDLAGWQADGDIVFRGRVDRQVKVRGVRIELGEVEAALLAVPEIGQAVAHVVTGPRGDNLLVAYVVGAPDGPLHLDSVRTNLADRLPPTMVPTFLVPLDDIPLTASGKVDRKALPAVEFAPLDEDTDDGDRTETERLLAEEVFKPLLAAPRVGNHDNFFALGGTSLQAIRIAPKVKAVFGVELPIADFFRNPTVSGTALAVDALLERTRSRRQSVLDVLAMVEDSDDEQVAALLENGGSGAPTKGAAL